MELLIAVKAARKVAQGLEQRDYAQAITEVIHALNREFGQQVNLAQLAAANSDLRAVITGDGALQPAASAIRGSG